jgi:uncharacterized repeat protein (TIGR01451 family)
VNASSVSATDTDDLVPQSDLSIAVTDGSGGTVNPGDAISYTITVSNLGPSDATGVMVTDTLPVQGLSGISSPNLPAGVTFNSATDKWTAATLAAGASETLTLSGTVPAAATGTTYANTAAVSALDSTPASSTDSRALETVNTVSVTNPGPQSSVSGTAITPLAIAPLVTDSSPTATLTYAATGLPTGLSINTSTGLISGTPNSVAGSPYTVTVTATDNDNFSGSATFNWVVTAVVNKVSVTNPGTQSSIEGTAITALAIKSTDSSPTATLTYSATGLPTGLSISTSTGVIAGTPTSAGTFSVQVSSKDATGASASASFTWNVLPPTSLDLLAVPGGTVRTGSLVAYGVFISKGSAAGTLSGTVSFTANGVPIAGCSNLHLILGLTACVTSFASVGSYAVVATYSGDPHFGSSSASLTEVVNQPPAFTSAATASATVGKPLSFMVTASGSPAPSFSESGSLPKGVILSSTGLLSGTPAPGTGGSYAITITAADAGGTTQQKFTLVVNQPPAFTSAATTSATVGKSLSFSVSASGYPAPTFSESGALPKGVTLSSAGLLSGIPAAGTAASYPITITTKSSAGTVQQSFTLKVAT